MIENMRDSERAAMSILDELETIGRRLTTDSITNETAEATNKCVLLLRFYVHSVAEGKRRLMEAYESFERLAPAGAITNGETGE